MRVFAPQLLLHVFLQLNLPSLIVADVPVFKQGEDTDKYLKGTTDTSGVEADAFSVDVDNGIHLKIGSDISKRVVDVVRSKCKDKTNDECTAGVEKELGVGPATDGIQRRVLGLGLGLLAAYAVVKLIQGAYSLMDGDPDRYHVITIDLSQEDADKLDDMTIDEKKFSYEYPDGAMTEISIDTGMPEIAEADDTTITEDDENNQVVVGLNKTMYTGAMDIADDVLGGVSSECSNQKRFAKRRTNGKTKCGPWKKLLNLGIQFMREAGPAGRLQPLLRQLQQQEQDFGFVFPTAPSKLVVEMRKDPDTERFSFTFDYEDDDERKRLKEQWIQLSSWMAYLTALERKLFVIATGLINGDYFGEDGMMRMSAALSNKLDGLTDVELPDMPENSCPLKKDQPYIFCDNCGGNTIPSFEDGVCKGVDGTFAQCSCRPSEPVPSNSRKMAQSPIEADGGCDAKRRKVKRQDNADPNKDRPDFDSCDAGGDDEPTGPKDGDKTCFKNPDYVKDIRNWKFVDEPTLAGNIKDFCDHLGDSSKAKDDATDYEEAFDNMGGNGRTYLNKVTLKITRPEAGSKWDAPGCKDDLKFLSDNCDYDPVANEYNWKWGGEYQKGGFHYTITPNDERAWTSKDKMDMHSGGQFFREVKQRDDQMDDSQNEDDNTKIVNWVNNDHWEYMPEHEQRIGKNGNKFDMVILHQCLAKMAYQGWGDDIECAGLVTLTSGHGYRYKDSDECWRWTWTMTSMCLLREGAMSVYGNQQTHVDNTSRCWVGVKEYDVPKSRKRGVPFAS